MLQKLLIEAYADPQHSRKIDKWHVQINPEAYRQTYRTDYTDDHGIDTAGPVLRYKSQAPQDLNLEFLLDSTGPVDGVDSVSQEIARLKSVAYDYSGDIHRPHFLRIVWGSLVFPCVLTGLDIDYELFKGNGDPLRARIRLALRHHEPTETRSRKARKNSPDLTHTHTVVSGDTLPGLCTEIYGNPRHCADVARINGLSAIRTLPMGAVLQFPPLAR